MSARVSAVSRRQVCLAGAGALLSGCGRKPKTSEPAVAPSTAAVGPSGPAPGTLEWAAAGDWRSAADKARDAWRHPVQSLGFWGLKPTMTVLEFWPALGWYSEIIAPYLERGGGKLIAAQFQGLNPAEAKVVAAYRAKLASRPGLFGQHRLWPQQRPLGDGRQCRSGPVPAQCA
jgi:hypothetical protein